MKLFLTFFIIFFFNSQNVLCSEVSGLDNVFQMLNQNIQIMPENVGDCLVIDPQKELKLLGASLGFHPDQCDAFTPAKIRSEIRRAYRGEDWLESSRFKIDNLKQNPDYKAYMVCRSLNQNLKRDSLDCRPDPKLIFERKLSLNNGCQKISGKIKYAGVYPLPYQYHFCKTKEVNEIRVKIFIEKGQDNISDEFLSNFSKAQNKWNEHNPLRSQIEFKFQLVNNPEDADYVLNLKNKDIRGPYCKNWSTKWDENTIAHEMGHMLGLDDEYNQLVNSFFPMYTYGFGESYCDDNSLMCLSTLKPQKHHYYLIMRRLFCLN